MVVPGCQKMEFRSDCLHVAAVGDAQHDGIVLLTCLGAGFPRAGGNNQHPLLVFKACSPVRFDEVITQDAEESTGPQVGVNLEG